MSHLNLDMLVWLRAVLDDQIESQTTTPDRIDEPSHYGIVSAKVPGDDTPYTFVRLSGATQYVWVCTYNGQMYRWTVLIDPLLLREGV